VYEHRRADSGEVFYVGKGQDNRAHSHANRNRWWRHIVEKHGRTVHIVADGLTEDQAFLREVELIAALRAAGAALVNMTNGGEGVSGLRRIESEETRAKKRASAIGRRMSPEAIAKTVAFHTGRKRSPETLAKISAALKGKLPPPITEASRAKMAAANIGRTHSAETRAKMSSSMTGKKKGPQSPEHRAKIAQKRREYWERWRAEKAAASTT
jgi:hypothetical protein